VIEMQAITVGMAGMGGDGGGADPMIGRGEDGHAAEMRSFD